MHIYADTITTANIVGVSAVVSDSLVNGQVTYNSTTFNTFRVNYDVEVIFDQAYLGYVQLTLEYDYSTRDSSGIVDRTDNQTRRVFVNGTSAHINLNIFSSYSNAPLLATYNNPRVSTITTGGTNVTPIGDLADIQQIIEILQDIYSLEGDIEGLENNQLLQLQKVVANTSLANEYLETLTKLQQLNVPIESFSFIHEFLVRYSPLYFNNYYNYEFPVFSVDNNFNIRYSAFTAPQRSSFIYKFYINQNIQNVSQLQNYFNVYNSQTLEAINVNVNTVFLGYINNQLWYEVTIEVPLPTSNLFIGFSYINSSSSLIIPIYKGYSYNKLLSTDFALRYGLTNQLLDDLHIIANGTISSSSSSNDLDDTTSQFQTDANSLISIEDSFNSTMNSNLDNINPTFNMGSSFLASANWVSTQFNRIVNNTPFASLITFGLTLGLGLLIIGKIRK